MQPQWEKKDTALQGQMLKQLMLSKKKIRFVRPVHVYLKTDKLEYLQSPMTDQIFKNIFSLRKYSSSPD